MLCSLKGRGLAFSYFPSALDNQDPGLLIPSSGAPSQLCQIHPMSPGGKGHSKGHQWCVLKNKQSGGMCTGVGWTLVISCPLPTAQAQTESPRQSLERHRAMRTPPPTPTFSYLSQGPLSLALVLPASATHGPVGRSLPFSGPLLPLLEPDGMRLRRHPGSHILRCAPRVGRG